MNKGKLLLKSIKRILPITLGCILGAILGYTLLSGNNSFSTKHIIVFSIGSFISFFILTGITWFFYIIKFNKKE